MQLVPSPQWRFASMDPGVDLARDYPGFIWIRGIRLKWHSRKNGGLTLI